MENTDGGRWGQNIALYIIAAVIVFALFMWFVHSTAKEKAELAAGVQGVVSRVNALEPAVTANGQNIYRINNTLAQTVQGVQFLKENVDAIDGAVYAPVCGGRRSCGCGGTEKFRKESTYTLDSTTLTEVDTCNN